jgi:hypothetical protein
VYNSKVLIERFRIVEGREGERGREERRRGGERE